MGARGRGLLIVALLVVSVVAGRVSWARYQAKQRTLASEALFGPLVGKLSNAAVHGVEREAGWEASVALGLRLADAAHDSADWGSFFAACGGESFDDVRPSLAAAALKLLRAFEALHAAQGSTDAAHETWTTARELLLVLGPALKRTVEPARLRVAVDEGAARALVVGTVSSRADRVEGLRERQDELMRAVLDLAAGSAHVLEEWDRVALLRDRSLAALAGSEWKEASAAGRAALEADPDEDVAALVAALAEVEAAPDEEALGRLSVEHYLTGVERRNPQRPVPVGVVRTRLMFRRGDPEGLAMDRFEELVTRTRVGDRAAGEAGRVAKLRAALRPVPDVAAGEARAAAVWIGAGPFSPALQLARGPAASESGEALRRHLVTHFHDRLVRAEEALLPVDLEFCRTGLGAPFVSAFPEEAFVELVATPAQAPGNFVVGVRNGSGRAATQGSLLLLARSANMPAHDVATIVVPAHPALDADGVTPFGEVDVASALAQQRPGAGAVESLTAILLTENTVALIGPVASKPSEALRQALRGAFGVDDGTLAAQVFAQARAELDDGRAGDVRVELPEALASLRPAFELRSGTRAVPAAERTLSEGHCVVRFGGAAKLFAAKPVAVSLRIESAVVSWKVAWQQDGDGGWKPRAVEETPSPR